MIFRGWFDGDETGFEARSSVVEAGRFPTDENFEHPAFGGRIGLRYELRQRQTMDDFSIGNRNVNASNQNHRHLGQRLIL